MELPILGELDVAWLKTYDARGAIAPAPLHSVMRVERGNIEKHEFILWKLKVMSDIEASHLYEDVASQRVSELLQAYQTRRLADSRV